MQHILPVKQSILLTNITGNLTIKAWDQVPISLISNDDSGTWSVEDHIVKIDDYKGAIQLDVPKEVIIVAKEITGEVGVECVQQVELQAIHGNVALKAITGEVKLGQIDGNVELKGIQRSFRVDAASGNIFIEAGFPAESVAHVRAEGNVHLVLPSVANLTIHAMVAGMVHNAGSATATGNHITLIYGNGNARLHVSAGGNLELYGDQIPKSTASYSGNAKNFAQNWQNIDADFTTHFASSMSNGMTHMSAKQQRKTENYRSNPKKRAKHANGQKHLHVRISNRRGHLEPQHIENRVAEAYDRAARGTQAAMEAVEQALLQTWLPKSPHGSHEHMRDLHTSESPKTSGEHPVSAPEPTGKAIADLEQERMTILRMVADGRITPEEGDQLLTALE